MLTSSRLPVLSGIHPVAVLESRCCRLSPLPRPSAIHSSNLLAAAVAALRSARWDASAATSRNDLTQAGVSRMGAERQLFHDPHPRIVHLQPVIVVEQLPDRGSHKVLGAVGLDHP